jgi:hypothetical protein
VDGKYKMVTKASYIGNQSAELLLAKPQTEMAMGDTLFPLSYINTV